MLREANADNSQYRYDFRSFLLASSTAYALSAVGRQAATADTASLESQWFTCHEVQASPLGNQSNKASQLQQPACYPSRMAFAIFHRAGPQALSRRWASPDG
ncbi:MAG: hypothetical protein ACE361_26235 [Aureliella sp.]